MTITRRVMIAAIAVLSTLAFLTSAASASRALRLTPINQLISLISSNAWTFGETSGIRIICQHVTLGISLSREEVLKSAAGRLPEGQIGWVTQGIPRECTESLFGTSVEAIVLTDLLHSETWFPLVYNGFLGTLPAITGVRLLALRASFGFNIPLLGAECLYEGTAGNLIAFNARGESTTNSFLPEATVRRIRGTTTCPATGFLTGSGTISPTLRIALVN